MNVCPIEGSGRDDRTETVNYRVAPRASTAADLSGLWWPDDTSLRGAPGPPDDGRVKPSVSGQRIGCHDQAPTTSHDHFSKRRQDGPRESSAPIHHMGIEQSQNESAISWEAAPNCRNRASNSSPIEHSPSRRPSRGHETGRSTEPFSIGTGTFRSQTIGLLEQRP
jgi:hypothetical protein